MLLSFDITCDCVTVLAIACVGLRVHVQGVGGGWDVVIRSDCAGLRDTVNLVRLIMKSPDWEFDIGSTWPLLCEVCLCRHHAAPGALWYLEQHRCWTWKGSCVTPHSDSVPEAVWSLHSPALFCSVTAAQTRLACTLSRIASLGWV